MNFETKEFENKMQKTCDGYQNELAVIRAGRANPEILNRVQADYYGTPTPVNQMASVSMPDARTLMIQPWDSQSLKLIEKAILASDIGITPISDGKVIRLSFPQPTEERRKEMQKQVSKMGEEAKVAIRNVRREANDKIAKAKKDGLLTEDDVKQAEKAVQDLTDRYTKKVDGITADKNKEIMSI